MKSYQEACLDRNALRWRGGSEAQMSSMITYKLISS